MGKQNYTGGHTVVGPESGWFSKRRILEDEAEEAARRKEAEWHEQIDHARSLAKEDVEQISVKQEDARRRQKEKKAKIRARREAKKAGTRKASSGKRPSKNMDLWLAKKNPALAHEVRKLFGD